MGRPRRSRLRTVHIFLSSSAWGERFDGYLAIRGAAPSAKLKAAVDQHNAMRRESYEQRAREQGVAVEQIARIEAEQIQDDAPAGMWFQAENRTWSQKE